MPRTLLVLLWKHSVVRRRRWFNTMVDLLAPISLFYLLYSSKDNINAMQSSSNKTLLFKTGIERLHDVSISGPDTILYLPDTPLVGLLMADIGRKLDLKRLPYFHRFQSGYYPCTDEILLEHFINVIYSRDAILIFNNVETWPHMLNYTIRMKQDFHTEDYAPLHPDHGPQTMYGEGYGTFMRIQWAVDSSFIEMQTGREIVPRVSIEEFPSVKSSSMTNNVTAAVVCSMLVPLCWLALMLTFVFLTCRLIEERVSGIQELIKMMGVTMNTLGISHFLNVLPVGLLFSLSASIILKTSDSPMLPNTNGVLIFLMLLLYFNTVVASAFVCSYSITSEDYASSLAIVLYGLMWMPAMVLEDQVLPDVVHFMTGILPHIPMSWFWMEVGARELLDDGVNTSNMFKSAKGIYRSVFASYMFLMLQAAIWYTLAWYLSHVRPGKYGQALPWNFIFQKCQRKRAVDKGSSPSDEELRRDENFFEPPPDDLVPGVSVEHVTKVYSKVIALKDVCLKVYQGEITVLLGHNGAGKTTLMSIITGMTNATTGEVYIHGFDTVTQQEEVRKHIGLCPQHNMCIAKLTLQEQIMFYTLLKRGSFSEARKSSRELAARLGLEKKLGVKCDALSGGMRRRAQLAYALAGNADVLVLDEPTTGLDVETRRELWDLILSLRDEHAVLISTHFMEEADALGDRVAALHGGELRCFASTMHLKKAIGTGYCLTLTTVGTPKETVITNEVLNHVSDASVRELTSSSISYNLPATFSNKFPKLFRALENHKSRLGIATIGIRISTLEDVFLKLCSNLDGVISDTEVEEATPNPTMDKYTGIRLYCRQFVVLLKRQIRFIRYNLWVYLALQVFLPLMVIYLITSIMNNKTFELKPSQPRSMDLDLYWNRPNNRILFNIDNNNSFAFRAMIDEYPGVEFRSTDNVQMAIQRISLDKSEYDKYLAGIDINETDAKILYTTRVRHAAPAALNMLSNMLAKQPITSISERIYTYNHPIGVCTRSYNAKRPKQINLAIMWAMMVVFFLQSTHLNCVTLPCRERATGSRRIHLISGCPVELHWTTTFIFHLSLSFITLILPTAMLTYFLDQDATFNKDFIVAFAVLLTVGCMPLLAFMYLVSFMFTARTTNIVLIGCLFIFVVNAWCELLKDNCPVLLVNSVGWNSECAQKCCAGETPRCYFCLDGFSPYAGMITLFIQFIVLMVLVFLSERGIFKGLKNWIINREYTLKNQTNLDQTILAERIYVKTEIAKHPNQILNDSLLVNDVHKSYVNMFGKSFTAVRGVSFAVKKGECFGLLGVNGAGKSTIFKMLTADEYITKGQIFSNGYHLQRCNAEYLRTLGYCPQFFGLDVFQTGRQNLELVLTLRGLNKKQVKVNVDAWIRIVGLEKYAKNIVESYSGGCTRRLGAAAALCSGSPLTLLDEPSAGVDVAARRRLWTALRKSLKQHRSFLITSHSMDEMESLCSRIAIMCDGRIHALGAPASLRAAHAEGYAVTFKLKHYKNADEKSSELVDMKNILTRKLNCTLRDEHKTIIHYHVNVTIAYSELFQILENLKSKFHRLIEDYSATETTLEEVFLSFAKKKEENA